VAELDVSRRLGDAGHHVVEHVRLGVQPRAGAATLAVVEEDRIRGTRDRDLEVAVGARLRQDPYRLAGDVVSDFGEAERLLAAGRRESALKLARGPLLPGATAPGVIAARERLLGLTDALVAGLGPGA
jgi:hypothetical protein